MPYFEDFSDRVFNGPFSNNSGSYSNGGWVLPTDTVASIGFSNIEYSNYLLGIYFSYTDSNGGFRINMRDNPNFYTVSRGSEQLYQFFDGIDIINNQGVG